ncbi:hypothetical protein [Mucilaginibacter lappiensis]|jgi:hypothetical protein|uniref:hypothetical protein n=1 Tax=Mucilaginibacter lappiensis TaxID=354630 RepID=UPI003D208F77
MKTTYFFSAAQARHVDELVIYFLAPFFSWFIIWLFYIVSKTTSIKQLSAPGKATEIAPLYATAFIFSIIIAGITASILTPSNYSFWMHAIKLSALFLIPSFIGVYRATKGFTN